jgi:gliding motility-associated-like protein
VLGCKLNFSAQFFYVPTTNSCTCDGSIQYITVQAGLINYTLNDGYGTLIQSASNNTGTVNFTGLCNGFYQLLININGNITSEVISVPSSNLNPGNADLGTVCSSSGDTELENFLSFFVPGGNWLDPNGNPHSGIYSPGIDTEGFYLYTLPDGACDVSTGVLVTYIVNANAGQSTTYLICEDYVPFNMLDFMAGAPDIGGQWFGPGNQMMNGQYNPATMNPGLFTYMVNTVPVCGPVFSTMLIIENQIPYPGEDETVVVCEGGTSFNMFDYLGGNPETGGQWYNPQNIPVGSTFNPAIHQPGVYSYLLTAETPCTNRESHLTIQFTNDNPSGLSGTHSICSNAASFDMMNFLGGNPQPGGGWTNPIGQTTDNIFNPSVDIGGAYTYYFPNVGCLPENSTLTVTLENLAVAGQDNSITVCENISSINLNNLLSANAATGGIWKDQGGNIITPVHPLTEDAGQYTFTYSINNTICPDDQSLFTLVIDGEVADPQDQVINICSTADPIDVADYYPGMNNLTFLSGNQPVATLIDPSIASNSTITVVNPTTNSCPSSSGLVTIIIQSPSFADTNIEEEICESTQFYDLTWSDSSIDFSNGVWTNSLNIPINPLIEITSSGAVDFVFTDNSSALCGVSVLNVHLDIFEEVPAVGDSSVVFCNSDAPVPFSLLLSGTSGSSGNWYYNGEIIADNEFNPASDLPGIYQFLVAPNGPCPGSSGQLDIEVHQPLDLSGISNVEVCAGSDNVLIGLSPTAGYNYLWTPILNLSNSVQSTTYVLIPGSVGQTENTNYTLNANDGICTSQQQVQVIVHPNPAVNLPAQLEICYGETANLSASGSGTFEWSPAIYFNDNTQPDQNISLTESTIFSLELTNNFGCHSSDSISVEVHPLPVIDFNSPLIEGCSPLYVHLEAGLNGQNISSYEWYFDGNLISTEDSINQVFVQPGYHSMSLTAISPFGCLKSQQYNGLVYVHPIPVAHFESDQVKLTNISPEANFINLSVNSNEWEWTFDEYGTSAEFSPSFAFPTFEVTNFLICLKVTSQAGCIDTTCQTIRMDNDYLFFAPNAFTPDNDGINDLFKPIFMGFENDSYSMVIFDRWGNKIFETTDWEEPWTGGIMGSNYYVQPDVYVWQVQLKDKELADYQTFNGHITVIR